MRGWQGACMVGGVHGWQGGMHGFPGVGAWLVGGVRGFPRGYAWSSQGRHACFPGGHDVVNGGGHAW